jgi:hypothetical protein
MFIRRTALLLICLLPLAAVRSEVFLRWTKDSVPPAASTGIQTLVVPWNAETLIRNGRRLGYRIYAEVSVGEASAVAQAKPGKELAGIILNPGDSRPDQTDQALRELQTAKLELPILVLNATAKQPQMKGQLVVKHDGVLQVTSATAQPWVDTNLALIRLDRAFRPSQVPLYEFQWDLSDPVLKERGPEAADYELAVAEAGAFHADLVLGLHPGLQADLLQNKAAEWDQVRRYLAFYSRSVTEGTEPEANIGVVTDDSESSYEPLNLLARHNLPFRVLRSLELTPAKLEGLDLLLVFVKPDAPTTRAIADFVNQGKVAVLVNSHGSYPWQSSPPVESGEHSATYALKKGRIIELKEPVIDPEVFAQDVRRLMEKDKMMITLWNALTTVAVSYRVPDGERVVELVNYAQEPLRVQVRVKGSFSSVRYETPESACCKTLAPVRRGGFTEFVVPSLRIAGRVRLAR